MGGLYMQSISEILSSVDISGLLLATVFAYVIGALPLADRVSRRQGVDIFRAGTGLAGSSNVMKSVGRKSGSVVFLGDLAKGIIVVIFAHRIGGVEDAWIVVPAAGAVVGHWNSVFTLLKGGDGLATLGGATLAVFGVAGFVGVAVAGLVAFGGQRMPYTSLFSVISGYVTIAVINAMTGGDMRTMAAMGTLAFIGFGHAILGHARRRRGAPDIEMTGAEQLAE